MRSNFSTSSIGKVIVAVYICGLCAGAWAQSAKKKSDSPWEISAGLGVASGVEYEGGKKTVSGLAPSFNLGYRMEGYGTFGFGNRGLSWTILDSDDYSFGIALNQSQSQSRTDRKDGSLSSPGSKRLRGMGEIKSTADYSVFGHATLGLPIEFEITRNSGDGKVKQGKIQGHGGTTIKLGTTLPYEVSPKLSLSFSPNLVWADKKYTQTYFGVSAAQAARSSFRAYKADGGIKSVGFDVGAQYQIDKNWSANAGVAYSVLRGDAAKSPIVQRKANTSFYAGVNYEF